MSVTVHSWNVLADAHMHADRYPNADAAMFDADARRRRIVDIIAAHPDDVWALQEADSLLADALTTHLGQHHVLWTPKAGYRRDGCVTIWPRNLHHRQQRTLTYHDHGSPDGSRSGHVAAIVDFDGWTFANTHLRWSGPDTPHAASTQLKELVRHVHTPAVIAADTNDAPNGPARHLLRTLGWSETQQGAATAVVGGAPVALDVIAVKGLQTASRAHMFSTADTMRLDRCPSDHVPVSTDLNLDTLESATP